MTGGIFTATVSSIAPSHCHLKIGCWTAIGAGFRSYLATATLSPALAYLRPGRLGRPGVNLRTWPLITQNAPRTICTVSPGRPMTRFYQLFSFGLRGRRNTTTSPLAAATCPSTRLRWGFGSQREGHRIAAIAIGKFAGHEERIADLQRSAPSSRTAHKRAGRGRWWRRTQTPRPSGVRRANSRFRASGFSATRSSPHFVRPAGRRNPFSC